MERIGVVPGTEVGGYRVVAPLGRGGSGSVYRAVDADGTLVALKLLHPHLGADPDARERLRREVANLQRVRHPAVARVLDAEIESTDAFLVTELLDGEDLAAHVRSRGPLDAQALAELAADLREALTVVHKAGVLHRDLTPGNVLMTSRGPVLIDFGIAQAAEDARVTSTGLVSGTPGYLSPELLEGGEPGAGSDWWGWAAVLAFAATGRPPFGTSPLQAVLAKARAGDADLADLDRRTAATLRSALAVDPWRRGRPEEVVAELEAVATGETWAAEDEGTEGATALVDQDVPSPSTVPGGGTLVVPAGGLDDPDRTARVTTADVARAARAEQDDDWSDEDEDGDWSDEDEDWSDDDEVDDDAEGPAPRPEDYEAALPEAPRRSGSVLAVGLVLLALGATRPGLALLLAVVVAVLVRSVGLAVTVVQLRRMRRGRRPNDTARAVVLWPWYLVRALAGVLPAALVAVSLVVVLGGVGWWLLDSGRFVVAEPAPGEAAGELAGNAGWVTPVLLAVAVLVGLLVVWFGPMSGRTRRGARWVLGGVAPGMAGAAVVVLVALAGAVALAFLVVLGHQTVWWPLPGPPDLR